MAQKKGNGGLPSKKEGQKSGGGRDNLPPKPTPKKK